MRPQMVIVFLLLTIFVCLHQGDGLNDDSMDDQPPLLAKIADNGFLDNVQPKAEGGSSHKIVKRQAEGNDQQSQMNNMTPLEFLQTLTVEEPVCLYEFGELKKDTKDEDLIDAIESKDEPKLAGKIIGELGEKAKEEMNGNEIFHRDGFALGLPGIPRLDGKKLVPMDRRPTDTSESDLEIVELGNAGMAQMLLNWANEDRAMRRIIKLGLQRESFTENGGFVKSQVRFARSLHCIQNAALLLAKKLSKDSQAVPVKYAIAGLWIGGNNAKEDAQKIIDEMKKVADLKDDISRIVNDGAIEHELQDRRQKLADSIQNVAEFEQKGNGSSMALMGVIWAVAGVGDKDTIFYNIRANDTFVPDEEDYDNN